MEDDKFDNFLINHWPHLVGRVARIEGVIWFLAGGMVAIVSLLGILVTKA